MTRRPKNPQRELPHGAGDVRQRNGRYQARWIDQGQRHSRMFDTADEANDYLRERYRNRRDGRTLTRAELTVADLIRDWLERGQDDWQPSTCATHRRYAELHVIPEIGHIRADALDTLRVQQWIDRMRRDGHGAQYIDKCLRVLSAAYRQAMQLGIVRLNPATGTKRPTVRKPEIVTWSAADIATIDAALADDLYWHAVYRLALTTGIRPGELRALRWEDIDVDQRTIRIRRTMTRDAEDRVRVGTQTKTGHERTVPLTASAAEALTRWRTEQKRVQLAARRWENGGYVFTGQSGQPLGASHWQRRHAALIAATGVPAITLHSLRHTFATLAMERNVHPRIVAELLGHRSIDMTLNRYSHPSSAMQQAASEALDSALFGPSGTPNGTDG